MHADTLINSILFLSIFFGLISVLYFISKKTKFPYTVILLVVGFLGQLFSYLYSIHIPFSLSTDIIYYVLLPLLLFESAFHINVHQFKLQFKTISFLATFGVLVSTFTVGFLLSLFLGLPFSVSLLFGALISATDPIAVLAIFKNLGAPKRLSLLADGESMFNDATGVIMFRLVSTFVVGASAFSSTKVIDGVLEFIWIFAGSIIVGAVFGLIASFIIGKFKHDSLLETSMTVALTFFSFIGAEHLLHLSGVISTVAAGITLGNLGKTKISNNSIHFIESFWEYVGFVCVSMIFFFSTLTLDLSFLVGDWATIHLVIISVLIARGVSVYLSCFISNKVGFFANEPNIPLNWQHVLVWGGLRGVIPLVLVYSLPDTYEYKMLLTQFTLNTFLFTLFFNATTIQSILQALGLHLPAKEEYIITLQKKIFDLKSAINTLKQKSDNDLNTQLVTKLEKNIIKQINTYQSELEDITNPKILEKSLHLQAIAIERDVSKRLFNDNTITEAALFEFESELNLQQDAIEHPDITIRAVNEDGKVDSSGSFAKELKKARSKVRHFPFLRGLLWLSEDQLILQRFSLLQARIVSSSEVITYLKLLQETLTPYASYSSLISRLLSDHRTMRLKNYFELQELAVKHKKVFQEFEKRLIGSYNIS